VDTRALGRGLRKRCPVCGADDLFESYFTLRERCLSCGLRFEREDGYWLGAMVVAIGAVILVFALVFLGGVLVTWPDVPWTGLLVATLLLNALVPIVLYPWCMTAWMGLHHAFVPSNRHETHRPR
jgi:uncharacterized protein (DUF983 family)